MRNVIFVIFLFLSNTICSQTTFEKRFVINSYSASNSILQEIDEGFIVLGDDRQNKDELHQDIVLLKLDHYGELIWSSHYGSQYDDYGNEVKKTFDKGYIIIGSTASNPSDIDVYVIKTDSLGNLIWERRFDVLDKDIGYSVIQTIDSGYIITGKSTSPNGPNTNHHLLIMRCDKNGDLVWQKVFANTYEGGRSIIQSQDSCYFICGYTKPSNGDNSNILLLKINSEGDSLWSRNFGGPLKEFGTSIIQLENSDLIITGYKADTISINNADSYFIKTNVNGDTIWTRTLDVAGYDISTSVEITNDDNLVFTGYGEMKEFNSKDVYMVKMSFDGDTIWKKCYGGPKSEYGNSIKQTIDNGYVICGVAFDFDTLQPFSRGIYIIKTDENGNVLHSSISESKKLQFEIYPNPSRNKFIVKAFEPISKIEIVDIMGSLKYYQDLESEVTEYEYSGKNLESGIYIVRVSIGVSELSRILIVE